MDVSSIVLLTIIHIRARFVTPRELPIGEKHPARDDCAPFWFSLNTGTQYTRRLLRTVCYGRKLLGHANISYAKTITFDAELRAIGHCLTPENTLLDLTAYRAAAMYAILRTADGGKEI